MLYFVQLLPKNMEPIKPSIERCLKPLTQLKGGGGTLYTLSYLDEGRGLAQRN